MSITCLFQKDPPIKRFAQRHMYLGIDAIADRDLGFAMARKATATNSLGKSETQQSLMSSATPQGTKRMASPDYRSKREDNRGGSGGSGDYNQGSKRMRPSSPSRGVDRDRETRWDGPSSRRRPFSPPPTSAWDRDDRPRAREPLPPSRAQEREEEKPRQVSIPPVISWFVGDLPAASSFDGEFFYFFLRREYRKKG
jgi:cleavage stimulation factor subunit 3